MAPRRRSGDRPPRAPAPEVLYSAPLETLVEEAELIAAAAVRIAVMNAIIVRSLRDGRRFDRDELAEVARGELLALAAEHATAADRLEADRGLAEERPGRALHPTDYRSGDVWSLRRREEVARGVAARLTALADDEQHLGALIASARDRALDEVMSSFHSALGRAGAPAADPVARTESLRLLAGDLEALASAGRRARVRESRAR